MTLRSRTATPADPCERSSTVPDASRSGTAVHRVPGAPRTGSRGARTGARAVLVALVAFGAGAGTAAGVAPTAAGAVVEGWWDAATGSAPTDLPGPVALASGQSTEVAVEAQRRVDPVSRSARPDGLPWATDAPTRAPELDAVDLVDSASEPAATDVVPQLAPAQMPPLEPGLLVSDVAAGLLSLAVPESGDGELVVVPGAQPAPGPGPVTTVRVEVESGLAVDPGLFALTVMTTLNDARGWGADGSISFARTDGEADLRVVLASPRLVDELCAPLETNGTVSCGTSGRAVLNLRRWIDGANGWSDDKVAYRQYLVNHEVGHLLGHGHERCAGDGQLAQLMQQQSGGLAGCLPNPWPFPTT